MGDQQHGPFKGLQGDGQRVTHFHVEVVGWLVQQQQVGALPGNQRQCQTGLLAAGKIQHRLFDAVALEVKAAEEVAQYLLALIRCQACQMQ